MPTISEQKYFLKPAANLRKKSERALIKAIKCLWEPKTQYLFSKLIKLSIVEVEFTKVKYLIKRCQNRIRSNGKGKGIWSS